MPRSTSTSVENNFSRGLITEATAMNYPENSVVETDNCVYLRNGSILRRNGIDFENSGVVSTFASLGVLSSVVTPDYNQVAINEFEWINLSENLSKSFLVVQLGDRLRFFEVDDTNSVSSNLKSFAIDLNTFSTIGVDPEKIARNSCSFSTGLGYLFVVHPFCEPFFIEYEVSTDSITTGPIILEERDFERLPDGLSIDGRPSTLSNEHRYNLYNQGWYASNIREVGGGNVQVMTQFHSVKTQYPANSDIWWLFKNAEDLFDPSIETSALLSSPAPNGHHLFPCFQTNRRIATGAVLEGIEERSSQGYRPSHTTFFSSRVWYAGVNYSDFSSKIYFTKLIESKHDFGRCYQMSDPTSENASDLLETDGGVIVIPEIVRVTGLIPLGPSLLVFASNGIWTISGSQGGFKANDYSIRKISSSPVDASRAVIVAENTPFWWSRSGIYTILIDPNSGELTVENISDSTIRNVLLQVPASNIENVKGIYNQIDKTVQWLYRTTEATNEVEKHQYNKIIVHDTISRSSYTHSIAGSGAYIAGAFSSVRSTYDPLSEDKSASTVSYITIGNFGTGSAKAITVSKFKNSSFVDWYSLNNAGVDFSSYFITGYRIRAELLRKFQSNYVVVMAKFIEGASCLFQGVWDYNSSESGKATIGQQIYANPVATKDYSRRKLKVRGNGYSLQFKFRSQPGKPFNIVGWAVSESAGNVP